MPMGLGMFLWMLLFWVGVFVLALWIAAWLFPAVPGSPSLPAQHILDTRYARGELTPEQYRQMRRELQASSRPAASVVAAAVAAAAVILIALALLALWGGWGWGPRPGGGPWWWMPHMGRSGLGP